MKNARLLLWCGVVAVMSGLASCVWVDRKVQPPIVVPETERFLLAAPYIAAARECVNFNKLTRDGGASALVTRDTSGCITAVELYYEADNCSGASNDKPDIEKKDRRKFFLGALSGNVCEEALQIERGSPCKLYTIYSGGTFYKFCYDYAVPTRPVLVPTQACVYHQAPCQ